MLKKRPQFFYLRISLYSYPIKTRWRYFNCPKKQTKNKTKRNRIADPMTDSNYLWHIDTEFFSHLTTFCSCKRNEALSAKKCRNFANLCQCASGNPQWLFGNKFAYISSIYSQIYKHLNKKWLKELHQSKQWSRVFELCLWIEKMSQYTNRYEPFAMWKEKNFMKKSVDLHTFFRSYWFNSWNSH